MAAIPPDIEYYHTMEVPGLGLVEGQWDLRSVVDQYLGDVSFAGKRVLEIGPASGFLTIEMERRGADVVAVEVPDDPGWDFVPYPESVMAPIWEVRRAAMTRIKKGVALHASGVQLERPDRLCQCLRPARRARRVRISRSWAPCCVIRGRRCRSWSNAPGVHRPSSSPISISPSWKVSRFAV
jgi:hypothetical protein